MYNLEQSEIYSHAIHRPLGNLFKDAKSLLSQSCTYYAYYIQIILSDVSYFEKNRITETLLFIFLDSQN